MITEKEFKERCAEILRKEITFSHQVGDYVIHGALDSLWKLHTEQNSHKHGVMQAGSEKQPYFQLSTNEFGKHWLFYKPLESEPGKYSCWMPIDDEFYSEFNKLQKAALGSEAAVGQRSVGTVAEDGDFSCWMSLGGGEQCKELCAECSGELARKSSEGQP